MGLFGGNKKSGKAAQATAPKQAKNGKRSNKDKKQMFGGKKKGMSMIERMQLEESVAAASLDVVQDLATNGGAAVREIEDGLLIVVFTNEDLENAGLDPAGEEFGSFAEALRSETVESIALAKDLANGIIGVIPSQETLLSLDEFDFVQDLLFKWAIVPFDLDDSDQLMVLEDTVHIARLVELANDPSIELSVRNGAVVIESDGEDAEGLDEYPDEEAYPEEDELPDENEDEEFPDPVDEFELPDEPLEDEFDPGLDDEPLEYGESLHDTGFDEELDSDPVYDFNEPEFDNNEEEAYAAVEQELMPVAESKEAINRAVNHGFNNTELNLTIDMTKFDDYFDAVTLAQFDTEKIDNSELQNVISKLRQDANTELKRFRQDNLTSLRNKFTTSMRDIHNRLVESLDHKDEETTYGERFHQIETMFQDAMGDVDRQIANEIAKLTEQYHEAREEFGENAKREAYSVYDTRYRSNLDRKTSALRTSVPADIKTNRDVDLGALYEDRRTIAQRLFDKATTALLQTLQEEHQNIARKELHMYDVFRKDMDVYLRRHFADEVLRAKAKAEELRQKHEAESVRQQYEEMLSAKAIQLQEESERGRNAVNQLEIAHREQMNEVKADYDKRLEREKRDSEEIRNMLNDATNNISKIGSQKEKEIAHQMKVLNDEIEAKKLELKYANERNARTQKPVYVTMVAAAMITLMLGTIAGFLFGAGSVNGPMQQAQPEQSVEDTVSYHSVPSAEVFATEYDHQDAA